MTPLEAAEALFQAKAAISGGPWVADDYYGDEYWIDATVRGLEDQIVAYTDEPDFRIRPNAEFIALSHEAGPVLSSLVHALEQRHRPKPGPLHQINQEQVCSSCWVVLRSGTATPAPWPCEERRLMDGSESVPDIEPAGFRA